MPTPKEASTRKLVDTYHSTDQPSLKMAIKEELYSRYGENGSYLLGEKKNRSPFIFPAWTAVGCLIIWMGLNYWYPTNKESSQQIETTKEIKKVEIKPVVETENHLVKIATLRLQVDQLEVDVARLETEKEKLSKNLEKVSEDLEKSNTRLWNLAMLNQENWARIRVGSKDMIYLGRDNEWTPERTLENVEKPGRDKINEKVKEQN